MLTITDNELVEGLFGAVGWVLFWYYFRNTVNYSKIVEGFISWTFVWWLRKFGINLYKDFKKKRGLKTRVFTLL